VYNEIGEIKTGKVHKEIGEIIPGKVLRFSVDSLITCDFFQNIVTVVVSVNALKIS
jgi:hypothetical protein